MNLHINSVLTLKVSLNFVRFTWLVVTIIIREDIIVEWHSIKVFLYFIISLIIKLRPELMSKFTYFILGTISILALLKEVKKKKLSG